MNAAIWMGAAALVWGQAAMAQGFASCACGGVQVSKPGLTLSGKTACAGRGADKWSEFHQADGTLVDYKGGTPETVGTWSSSNTAVTYNYGSGGTYTWFLCKVAASNTYNFCQGSNVVSGATLKAGQTSCP